MDVIVVVKSRIMNFGFKEFVGKDIEFDKEFYRNSFRFDIDVWL